MVVQVMVYIRSKDREVLFSGEGYYTNSSQTMAPSMGSDSNGYYRLESCNVYNYNN